MTTPIDYSKWEKIIDSDSDADDTGIVTKVYNAASVTIGPDGIAVNDSRAKLTASPTPSSTSATNRDEALTKKFTRNGGKEGDSHWWSQTDISAIVRFPLPLGLKAKDIRDFCISEMCTNSDDSCSTHPFIRFSYSWMGATVSIFKVFSHPLNLSPEVVDGCWELQDGFTGSRVLVVEVHKKVISEGVVLWWDRCFTTDTESLVDTKSIQDRKKSNAEHFQQVWKDAHELFKQRIRTKSNNC